MNQNTLVTCAALVGVCVITAFLLLFPSLINKKLESEQPVPPNTQELSSEQKSFDHEYLLKSYEGKLAVFLPQKQNPEKVFDVWVSSLPQYDRGQLELGIPIKNYEELVERIEDYIS